MDFEFTEEEKAFRAEADAFFKQELPSNWDEMVDSWPGSYGNHPHEDERLYDHVLDFLKKLGAKGWLTLGWPKEYGGGESIMKQAILDELGTYYHMNTDLGGSCIVGPTMIAVASEEMKKEWLPKIARGEIGFWLGYSEPDAGSDLASLRTRAVDGGDHFIVNGQKTWSSAANLQRYGLLLARTDPDARKHRGITMMLVDTPNTAGITIVPIVNISGHQSFNEVFFDDVKIPKENVIGEVNKGFYNVTAALLYERVVAVGVGGFKRYMEELIRYVKETLYNGEALSKNSFVRNKVASMAIDVEALYSLYWRTAWLMDQGRMPDTEASALKLFATELGRTMAHTSVDVLGLYGQLRQGVARAPIDGKVSSGYLACVSGSIGAGTSEIQKTIIATRGLGLPRK